MATASEPSDLDRGILVRKIVPSDNSCLFTSLCYVLKDQQFAYPEPQFLRDIVAKEIMDNPDNYKEAMLSMSSSSYATWIKDKNNWGGELEIFILSKHYKVEVVVVNTVSGVIIRFGESSHYGNRVFLYYDGIHYDPLELESDYCPTVVMFPGDAKYVLDKAVQLAKESHQARDFVNVQSFHLKCSICGALMVGQSDAGQHAFTTKHANFEEYRHS